MFSSYKWTYIWRASILAVWDEWNDRKLIFGEDFEILAGICVQWILNRSLLMDFDDFEHFQENLNEKSWIFILKIKIWVKNMK